MKNCNPPEAKATKETGFSKLSKSLLSKNLEDSGIFLGTKSSLFRRRSKTVSIPKNINGHMTVFGGTGSGKSSNIVIPTIVDTWDNPFVAIDIKGELKREYDKKPHKRGARVFSLGGEKDIFYSYDPFYFIRQDEKRNIVRNVRELVNAIIPMPQIIREPFWIQAAQNYLIACLLYYIDLGATFNEAMMNITSTPISILVNDINESNAQSASMFINHLKNANISESQMILGIQQELLNHINIFATDKFVIDALNPSENQIKWDELDKYNIFIQISEDKLDQYSGIITLMLTQLIRMLERRPEKHNAENLNPSSVLLMLDEFPRLGKIEVITNAVSTLRSKNVNICLVMQSIAQLDLIYGEKVRRVILDNCYIYPHELRNPEKLILLTPDGNYKVDKTPYHSKEYQELKNRKPKTNILEKAKNFFKQAPAKVTGFFKSLFN